MAIYHLSTKHVCRASGRSAVAASAYRSATRLTDERIGKIHDYTRKRGVVHSEIILPTGSEVEWAMNRSALWNTAEKTERRKDSRTAREVVIALPCELDSEQRLALTREFAQQLADQYKVAIDIAIHEPDKASKNATLEEIESSKNHHAHFLMTTRIVGEDDLGEKSNFERADGWLSKNGLPSGTQQVEDLRVNWGLLANEHLARAGFEIRIDHRSHADRGINIEPTKHEGVHATNMRRKGMNNSRVRLTEADKKYNEQIIRTDPDEILSLITSEMSVFNQRDVARYIHRYVGDQHFQNVFASVMTSGDLVQLQPETWNHSGQYIPARFTTKEMIGIETTMVANTKKLQKRRHKVSWWHASRAIAKLNKTLKARTGGTLSKLQRRAVKHLTGKSKISAVVGLAGTGKSTMLAAAKTAWESSGYRVRGAALAGKATDGLQRSSGIRSQTLASLEKQWKSGKNLLRKNDVLIIDEAGMLDSRQLARVISEVENRKAKLVLVGDPEQLQPIGAGAAFRAIVDEIGAVELNDIRRQDKNWQKKASSDFATGRTGDALESYNKHGSIRFGGSKIQTLMDITRDYLADLKKNPSDSRLVLAHRRADVKMLNNAIRAALQANGLLPRCGSKQEFMHITYDGIKSFATGDRVVLLENNSRLGVKNGMLGTIDSVGQKNMNVTLDDTGQKVTIPMRDYKAVDYGYTTTIHKAQGTTVDNTFVLASNSMDRHLTYVGMTRHRTNAKMYAPATDFKNLDELSSKLTKSRTKETVLDYFESFSSRRGLEYDFSIEPKPVHNRTRNPDNPSKLDIAFDTFIHAVEERYWLRRHGVDKSTIPNTKINKAINLIHKAKPGLTDVIDDFVKDNSKTFWKIVIEKSGQDRVEALKFELDKANHQNKPETDTRKKYEQPFESGMDQSNKYSHKEKKDKFNPDNDTDYNLEPDSDFSPRF